MTSESPAKAATPGLESRLRRMDAVLSVLLILAALAAVICVSRYWLLRSSSARRSGSFRPGAPAPALPAVEYRGSERTLLVFLSTECGHCEAGVPHYNKLAEVAAASAEPHRRRVVVLFPQDRAAVAAFMARTGLSADSLAGIRLPDAGVRATPTVLLVSGGKIQGAWVGASPAFLDQITQAFAKAAN